MSLFSSVLFLQLIICDGANILFLIATPLYSHQKTLAPVYLEMAKRHNVTVVSSSEMNEKHLNITYIYLKETVSRMRQFLAEDMNGADTVKSQQMTTFKNTRIGLEALLEVDMVNLIKSGRKFDLFVTELCVRFAMIFSKVFQAPMLLMSTLGGSFDTFSIVSSPEHPILYPIGIRARYTNLTDVEKATEVYRHYDSLKLFNSMGHFEEDVVRKYLDADFPSINEMNNNIDLVLLNLHPMWDSNRPVPPNLLYLGGLHLQEHRDLPPDLISILEQSNGAVYMSFGSSVRSINLDRKKIYMFVDVLSKLAYTVLWKWDLIVKNVPENVIIRKWFPQRDLLRHPKMKLFITQGGLQSIDESIDARVPMVGVPILWDQFYNVDKMVDLGIGVMCDIRTVTENQFKSAVDNVLTDHRYRVNIKKLRKIMNDKMQNSLERAVWWLEYVTKHKGAKHLRSPAFNMSVREYYEIDLLLYLILTLFIVIFFVVRTTRLICKRIKQYNR